MNIDYYYRIDPPPKKNPSVEKIVKFKSIKTLFGLHQDLTELQTCSSHYQCGFLFEAFYRFIIIILLPQSSGNL